MDSERSPQVSDANRQVLNFCAPGVRIVFVGKRQRFYDLVIRDEHSGRQAMLLQRGIGEIVRFLNGWDVSVDADNLRRQLDEIAAGRRS